uniref:Uncharacterized protein n=1 Tax=Anguilla anguilla TaxID=7936 RepID=A0A0E9PAV1_ANGAN
MRDQMHFLFHMKSQTNTKFLFPTATW